jgi:hypothetical protein
MWRRLAAALVGTLAATSLLAAPARAAEPIWRVEQPSQGSPFLAALGGPGDLQFTAANRGLMMVNGSLGPRIWAYDGVGWHEYSEVCGTDARHGRIAWAGARELWTIANASLPRHGVGQALCRIKDGQVVGSFSTPPESADPFREMQAAACTGPDDCWFAGLFAEDQTGERRGAFHLRWSAVGLQTLYAPQGRGVTDLEAFGATIFETVMVGRRVGQDIGGDELTVPEPVPHLIHRIAGGQIVNDPFIPATLPGVPDDGSELLTLDGDGVQLWAGGGGAASGASAIARGVSTGTTFVERPPLVARLEGDAWREIPLSCEPPSPFSCRDRIVDIAPVPGTDTAWAAVSTFGQDNSTTAEARVARIAADGTVEVVTLPESAGRGQAAKIAFTAPNEGWAVTTAGWLYHFLDTEAPRPDRDTDPAFAGKITARPNEAAEQFIPDRPPVDDSELFKPPPETAQPPPGDTRTRRLPALLRRIKTARRGMRLIVSFTLVRRARVGLTARRGGKVVARAKPRMMRPGRRRLVLKLQRKRWPKRLSFSVREPGVAAPDPEDSGGDGDTITTGLRGPVSTSR